MKKPLSFWQLSAVVLFVFIGNVNAQFPARALVGYYETWNADVKLNAIHPSYNVINLAFATSAPGSSSALVFDLPSAYPTLAAFKLELDALHAQGKVVLLSIGGETANIALESESDKNTFVTSLKNIFAQYDYKIDGIDIDIEGASVKGDIDTWTIAKPSARQKYLIEAIKALMADYQSHTNKKMCLTMAPEVAYVQGGMSEYQVSTINGGWYLVLIEALRNELDMLNCQLYNVYGEAYAIDGKLHMEGSGNFIVAMVESAIVGFTLKYSKGVYSGLPANKVGFGTVGNNVCAAYDFSSFMKTSEIIESVSYLRGKINKPAGWKYTCLQAHASLRGMMIWSINKDYNLNGTGICDESAWTNAKSFSSAFPADDDLELKELSASNVLNVYPNPAINNMMLNNLSASTIAVQVLNNLGEVQMNINLNSGLNEISIAPLSSGFYWLKTDGEVKRLIVR